MNPSQDLYAVGASGIWTPQVQTAENCLRHLILTMNSQALLLLNVLLLIPLIVSQSAVSKSSGPPAFFLQDPTDGKCLSGNTFRRCALNTLWYVVGKPGHYQIRRRADEDEDNVCLSKSECHLDETEVELMNCQHCGSKKWNIIGDVDTGTNQFCGLL